MTTPTLFELRQRRQRSNDVINYQATVALSKRVTTGRIQGESVDEQRQSQNLRVITGIEFGK
ncbi:hypothetical protein ACE1CI_27255 [Aerosakkonemataceae cyanobacterium BLCC-F50]|uniref:Uncharacterized protein n=1 Tax=Floridaenema flaviceps BLCC-F50 TaxID=3153642 RepID=A0ABV4XZG3_9CYAN